ncbi:MAG: family 43 glycosylhydrolase [Deltaproteobacteria bacterium]|nr:family 43 glycosylhydrolase [Deltaproteobacteria bacterium]
MSSVVVAIFIGFSVSLLGCEQQERQPDTFFDSAAPSSPRTNGDPRIYADASMTTDGYTTIDSAFGSNAIDNADAKADAAVVIDANDRINTGTDASAETDGYFETEAATDAAAGANEWVTFTNGEYWSDIDGERIQAHGGGFIQVDDTWYWIGEDKSHNQAGFRGVNCYASRNLVDWEFRNAIITRTTHPDLNTSDRIIERPKVIYNDATGQYVMWLHWEGQNYADAEAGVFYCDTVCGDYALYRHFRPNNNMSRDGTLFKDDDGTAYFISAANENADLIIYELQDDYLDIERQVTTLWISSWREAPAVFKQADRYYLITSGATGWDPNQARYASASSIDGPWSPLQSIGDGVTYDSQPAYAIPYIGSVTTTFIYAGDRWQDPDLESSKYIWLPIKKNGTSLALDYYERWRLNLHTGEWRAYDEFLPQSEWTLIYVDSEETDDEDGRAINAFDDISSSIWHTQWDAGGPHAPLPHEIQIDLGAVWNIDEMRYLPRQDGNENGIIIDYEFYAGMSRNDWGYPVAAGAFTANQEAKRVSFTTTRARYVRLVALSEINGDEWASVAELDLIGEIAR